ncbi:MAG: hypothetical protein Q4G65_16555, partial [bacterium]|nr:hypothetical protein [bacterium]
TESPECSTEEGFAITSQVIGAGVVATSIRSKDLRMRSICVLHKALEYEKRSTLIPKVSIS